jgi:hypothetical protein
MVITRIEAHDILADLERIRARLAPATLRLLRQLEDAHTLMGPHTLVDIHVAVKRQTGLVSRGGLTKS